MNRYTLTNLKTTGRSRGLSAVFGCTSMVSLTMHAMWYILFGWDQTSYHFSCVILTQNHRGNSLVLTVRVRRSLFVDDDSVHPISFSIRVSQQLNNLNASLSHYPELQLHPKYENSTGRFYMSRCRLSWNRTHTYTAVIGLVAPLMRLPIVWTCVVTIGACDVLGPSLDRYDRMPSRSNKPGTEVVGCVKIR